MQRSRIAAACVAIALTASAYAAAQEISEKESGTADESLLQLDDVEVIGVRDEFSKLDMRLKTVKDSLPCAGCEGSLITGVPPAVRFGLDVATFALKTFFQQPRVRGEPNDEALYLAIRSANCVGDIGTTGCPNNYPSAALVNWVAEPSASDSQFEFPKPQ